MKQELQEEIQEFRDVAEVDDIEKLEPTPNGIRKFFRIVQRRIRTQGLRTTLLWLYVMFVGIVFGYIPIRYSRITPQLFVGSQHNRLGKFVLSRAGVTASINLREEYDYESRTIIFDEYFYIPVPDETAMTIEQIEKGVGFIRQIIDHGGKIYVHCASGVGRSVMLVTAYLMTEGLTLTEAFNRIQAVRPFVYFFPSQQQRLEEYASHLQKQNH